MFDFNIIHKQSISFLLVLTYTYRVWQKETDIKKKKRNLKK
jgi:hypothetical protein